MKLIAHRGASFDRPENTIESLRYGSQIGAYAVECDLRQTKDGVFVTCHDDNLFRLTGNDSKISEITAKEMEEILGGAGLKLMYLSDILDKYREKAFVLLHIKIEIDESVFKLLWESEVNFICGIETLENLKKCRKYFPKDRILAFAGSREEVPEFYENGAGILRLWQNWLEEITPDEVKKTCPESQVWIMSNSKENGMDGNLESLKKIYSLNADGVLLNNIKLGIEFMSDKTV